nr:MAG TPA: hypothetical protein [Caudoviricetes sp.]
MLSLDYSKQTENGCILVFFADSVDDIEEVSNGKEFISRNGTNYGVPAVGSVITVTSKDTRDTVYVLNNDGNWELKNDVVGGFNIFEFTIDSNDVVSNGAEDEEKTYSLTSDALSKLDAFVKKIDLSKMISGIFSVTEAGGISYFPLHILQDEGGIKIGWTTFMVDIAVTTVTGKVTEILGTSLQNGPVKIKIICE